MYCARVRSSASSRRWRLAITVGMFLWNAMQLQLASAEIHKTDEGPANSVAAAPVANQVRLAGGDTRFSGRVEIFYDGVWGTVCDDDFGIEEANVVCRQLGLVGGVPYTGRFGQATGQIWLDDVACDPTVHDQLHLCANNGWGIHNCDHTEDVGVICTPEYIYPIMLVDGPSQLEGRLMIFYNGSWGTVCDDDFGVEEANVICRQLTLGNGGGVPASFGPGEDTEPIWLDNVACDYTIEHQLLSMCSNNGWGTHDCTHAEDVGVRCSRNAPPPSPRPPLPPKPSSITPQFSVRLVGGTSQLEGRVEIFYNGFWGTVCDDDFGVQEAQVICRQLRFRGGIPVSRARFGQGTGRIWLDGLRCNPLVHNFLHACPHNGMGMNDCGHKEDAGVICSSPSISLPPPPPPPMGAARQFEVRLVNGSSVHEGRVEIFYNGMWGTVCDDKFDVEEARVICRQLGFSAGAVQGAGYDSNFGQGTGPIWLDELNCDSGVHNFLQDCPHSGWGTHNCGHKEDAGVVCLVGGSTSG